MCVNRSELDKPLWSNLKFAVAGILFGIILVKSEVISWFRIQEMFRLQSFHMYGVIGSAIVVGIISVFIIKKFKIKTIDGEQIHFESKKFNKGQIYGGLLFGFGWALTGACPGTIICTNRNRSNCNHRNFIQCHCGYMGVWIFKRKIAALIYL